MIRTMIRTRHAIGVNLCWYRLVRVSVGDFKFISHRNLNSCRLIRLSFKLNHQLIDAQRSHCHAPARSTYIIIFYVNQTWIKVRNTVQKDQIQSLFSSWWVCGMNFQPNCTDSEAGSDKISHRIEVLQMISNLGIACPLSTRFFEVSLTPWSKELIGSMLVCV